MDSNRLCEIIEFVGGDVKSINVINDTTIVIDNEKYLVYTEEEANAAFVTYQEDLWNSMGLDSFSTWHQDYIFRNFIDTELYEDEMEEYYARYVDELRIESGRLALEMEAVGAKDEGEYISYLCRTEDSATDWYINMYGRDALKDSIINNRYSVDFDSLIVWLRDNEGRGCLSCFNGEEDYAGDFYVYRID